MPVSLFGVCRSDDFADRSVLRAVLDREADASHLILAEADRADNITDLENILDSVNTRVRDLGDMDHSLLAGSELEESAELLDGDDLAGEDHSLLKVSRDDADRLDCLIHLDLISTADRYGTVVINVDLDIVRSSEPTWRLRLSERR